MALNWQLPPLGGGQWRQKRWPRRGKGVKHHQYDADCWSCGRKNPKLPYRFWDYLLYWHHVCRRSRDIWLNVYRNHVRHSHGQVQDNWTYPKTSYGSGKVWFNWIGKIECSMSDCCAPELFIQLTSSCITNDDMQEVTEATALCPQEKNWCLRLKQVRMVTLE